MANKVYNVTGGMISRLHQGQVFKNFGELSQVLDILDDSGKPLTSNSKKSFLKELEAFATQNTDFVTDTDDSYNPETQPRKVPTQLVYASSQDTMDKLFYRYYKNFAKRMIAGDRDYFVCDMICDVAIQVYMNGKPYKALLTRDKVEAAL